MTLLIWLVIVVVVVWLGLKMVGGLTSLIASLLIGAVAGWLAGKFMRGRGFGVLKNILVGITGGVVGGIVFGLLGLRSVGIVGSIATATIGAVLILSVVRWVQSS